MLDASPPSDSRGRLSSYVGDGEACSLTDPGCERDLNEDRCECISQGDRSTWVVCDGMGGVEGGDLAAQLAIDAMQRALVKYRDSRGEVALKEAILEAHRSVVLRRQNQVFGEMGTTAVAVLIDGGEVHLANVGDSRAYVVRGDSIEPLTVDHTYVQELVEAGEIGEDEMLDHPQAHVLTRCIGYGHSLEVDLRKLWIWRNVPESEQDCLVLVTDGLYTLVADNEIASVVGTRSPQEACSELIELGKSRGGFDNLSVAIIPIAGQLRDQPEGGVSAVEERAAREKYKVRAKPPIKLPSVKRLSQAVVTLMLVSGVACAIALGLMLYFVSL